MRIQNVTILPCHQRMRDANWKFARAAVRTIDGYTLALTDDAGNTGLGYVHAIPAITTHGDGARSALEFLRPMLLGRQVQDLAQIMEEIERALAFQHSVKAGVDMALHDLLARSVGVPVAMLLGGAMRREIPLARIIPIKSPLEMAASATSLLQEGYRQVKLKLSGDTALDIERVASVRSAVGSDVQITLDPNQAYSAKQMIAAFRHMERHDITLIEQPVPAADWAGLALLTRSLPVAIEADESAVTVHDVHRLVAERTVDAINLKITKLGGLRRFMQAVRICEAGGVACRMGAAFGPALLQGMSAQAASTITSLPYACELSEHLQLDDDPFTPVVIDNGVLKITGEPGGGVTLQEPPAFAPQA